MEQVGIAQSTPATRVTVHRKKHSIPTTVTYTVVMHRVARMAEVVTGNIVLSMPVLKAVVLSKKHLGLTTVLLTNVCMLDVIMVAMDTVFTVRNTNVQKAVATIKSQYCLIIAYYTIKGVEKDDL